MSNSHGITILVYYTGYAQPPPHGYTLPPLPGYAQPPLHGYTQPHPPPTKVPRLQESSGRSHHQGMETSILYS